MLAPTADDEIDTVINNIIVNQQNADKDSSSDRNYNGDKITTAAATTATSQKESFLISSNRKDINSIHPQQQYKPLPLSHPNIYFNLVKTLYNSSYAIILGNMLEWLDFSIYAYSESIISEQLFNGNNAVGWLLFGIGFAVRPLGAYLLGKLADSKSRKLSFIISILCMSFSTAFMSAIPATCNSPKVTTRYCITPSSYWILSPAVPIAIILRLIQGLSAGGAAGGINVIQSELWSTSSRKHVLTQSVGVNNVSGATASMLSAGIVLGLREMLGEVKYASWGWRIAFLVVVPPSLISSYLTYKSMPESNDFAEHDGQMIQQRELEDDNDEDDHDKQMECAINYNNRRYTDGRNGDDDDYWSDEEVTIRHQEQNNNNYLGKEEKLNSSRGKGSLTKFTIDSNTTSLTYDSTIQSAISTTAICHVEDASQYADKARSSGGMTLPIWLLVCVSIYIQFAIAAYNNLNVYMVQYVTENYDNIDTNTATLMAVIGKGVQVVMTIPTAFIGDIKGWFWTAGVGGLLCSILATPMMATSHIVVSHKNNDSEDNVDSSAGSNLLIIWALVAIIEPCVATLWILTAPLLVTSIFPVEIRSKWTSIIMATGVAFAGFSPLVLNLIPSMIGNGLVLTLIASLGTAAIVWIRHCAKNKGLISIYQRPELY